MYEHVNKMYEEMFAKMKAFEQERKELTEKFGVKEIYKEYVAMGTRWLNEQGLSPAGDSGDVSLRDPDTGLIYISGGPIEVSCNLNSLLDCQGWQMSVVDIDGNLIVPWSYPTVEMPMHLAIYKAFPDVNCVVHTHGPWSTVFAMAGMDIPFLLAEQVGSLGPDSIKCPKEYGQVGSFELGEAVVKAMGRNKAALMRNHGAVIVGRDLKEGFRNAHFLEDIAKKTYAVLKMGQTAELDVNDVYNTAWNRRFD